jgi:hypothetical protein
LPERQERPINGHTEHGFWREPSDRPAARPVTLRCRVDLHLARDVTVVNALRDGWAFDLHSGVLRDQVPNDAVSVP